MDRQYTLHEEEHRDGLWWTNDYGENTQLLEYVSRTRRSQRLLTQHAMDKEGHRRDQ